MTISSGRDCAAFTVCMTPETRDRTMRWTTTPQCGRRMPPGWPAPASARSVQSPLHASFR